MAYKAEAAAVSRLAASRWPKDRPPVTRTPADAPRASNGGAASSSWLAKEYAVALDPRSAHALA